MARATHVKKARKDIPGAGIKKGDEYWWWSFRVGMGSSKRYSKTPPRASQLTNSEFMSQALALQEQLEDITVADEELANIRDEVADAAEALADEEESKVDNMPDSLQNGSTGEMMRERAQAMRDWAEELRGIDIPEVEYGPDPDAEEAKPGDVDDDIVLNQDDLDDALSMMQQSAPNI